MIKKENLRKILNKQFIINNSTFTIKYKRKRTEISANNIKISS